MRRVRRRTISAPPDVIAGGRRIRLAASVLSSRSDPQHESAYVDAKCPIPLDSDRSAQPPPLSSADAHECSVAEVESLAEQRPKERVDCAPVCLPRTPGIMGHRPTRPMVATTRTDVSRTCCGSTLLCICFSVQAHTITGRPAPSISLATTLGRQRSAPPTFDLNTTFRSAALTISHIRRGRRSETGQRVYVGCARYGSVSRC